MAICASLYLSQVTTAPDREILFFNMFNLSSKQIIGCIFVGKYNIKDCFKHSRTFFDAFSTWKFLKRLSKTDPIGTIMQNLNLIL